MASATKLQSPYSVHPGVAMVQKWVQELPHKTGRSLEEWIALTKKSGPSTKKERRRHNSLTIILEIRPIA